MADSIQQQLQQAYNLIKGGQKEQAVRILVPILRQNENDINAWWLLANAVTKPDDVREALENVLRLKPDHENARKMLERLNQLHPPVGKFDFEADPFADVGSYAAPVAAPVGYTSDDPFGAAPPGPARPQQRASRKSHPSEAAPRRSGCGSNPLVIILAVVGVIAVLGCLACGGLSLAGVQFSTQLTQWLAGGPVPEIFQQLNNEGGIPSGQDMQRLLEQLGSGSLISAQNKVNRGSIGYGETRSDNVAVGEQHVWTFNGNAGDTVVIDMIATDNSQNFDPLLILYNSNGEMVDMDDDGGDNLNARLRFSLPASGTYMIGAQSFMGTSGGSYELRLSK